MPVQRRRRSGTHNGLLDPWTEAKSTERLGRGDVRPGATARASSPNELDHDLDRRRGDQLERQDERRDDRRRLGRRARRRDRGRRLRDRFRGLHRQHRRDAGTAKNLTVSADTDNTAPTNGTASPKGDESNGNDTSANNPTNNGTDATISSKQSTAADGKADGKSKTADGNQNNQRRARRSSCSSRRRRRTSPRPTARRRTRSTRPAAPRRSTPARRTSRSATADAGNVKFSPDAPTLTAVDDRRLARRRHVLLQGHRDLRRRREPPERRGQGRRHRRRRERQGLAQLDGGRRRDRLQDLPRQRDRRRDAAQDDHRRRDADLHRHNPDRPATERPTQRRSRRRPITNSGIAVGVSVDVAVITTKAFLRHNANLKATTVTVETTAPAASSFQASSTSGAGGSSVGVAGSIAVNVVVSNTTTDVEGTDPVAVNGADLALSATSNLDNQALATAKQATDGSASGVGISVAINVVNDTTTAGLPDNAVLNGAKNLTIDCDRHRLDDDDRQRRRLDRQRHGGARGAGRDRDLERHDDRHRRHRARR